MTAVHHVVAMPRWVLGLRIAQAILALLILALVSYSYSELGSAYIGSSYILNIITCILTFIVLAYITFSALFLPKLYNMWAALALEIFMVIMWLVAFAVLASQSADMVFLSSYDFYYYYKKRDLAARSLPGYRPWDTGAAGAGLGGLEFILFIVTLVLFSINLNRHRKGAVTSTEAPPLAGAPAVATQEPKYDAASGVPQTMPPQAQPQMQPQPGMHPQQQMHPQPHMQPQQQMQPQPQMQPHTQPTYTAGQNTQQYSSAPEVVNTPASQPPVTQ
ncbi:MAG: hypothetical protein M1817_001860 [Caeruleum heppii]|nr:MAG: hypothetical protein M1817_001860 [Caeruleum heppii]